MGRYRAELNAVAKNEIESHSEVESDGIEGEVR
jgi:hypothetical protein